MVDGGGGSQVLHQTGVGGRGHADPGRDNQDVGPDREGNDGTVVSSKAADLMVLSELSGHVRSRQLGV